MTTIDDTATAEGVPMMSNADQIRKIAEVFNASIEKTRETDGG